MPLNEELLRLTEENKLKDLEIKNLKDEIANLQKEYANKLADAKLDFETRELKYKSQIRDLTFALETRKDFQRNQDRDKKAKSVNEVWDDATIPVK